MQWRNPKLPEPCHGSMFYNHGRSSVSYLTGSPGLWPCRCPMKRWGLFLHPLECGLCDDFNPQNVVVLCWFCTEPLCGLEAHASCLLEASHCVRSAAIGRLAFCEIYRAHRSFLEDEGACGDRVRPGSTEASNLCVKRPFREWNLQPPSQLMPRGLETSYPTELSPDSSAKLTF